MCGPLTSPPGAPANEYAALVGVETLLFADDFEADLGWSVSNTAGVTSGFWERAVPLAGGTQEDPVTDSDGSGQCYVTQNLNGNFDVDGGTVFLVSPVLEGLVHDRRTAIVYSHNDLGGAWSREDVGTWTFECYPGGEPQRDMALRLGVNLVMYALCLDYKTDQVHVPFLLKRRKWRP